MLQRTTISLEQNYLDFLKLLSLRKQKSLSQLVNEAVMTYLSKVELKTNNKLFFKEITKINKKIKITKNELNGWIKKGRL